MPQPDCYPLMPTRHCLGELIHGSETAQENGKEDEEGGENYDDDDQDDDSDGDGDGDDDDDGDDDEGIDNDNDDDDDDDGDDGYDDFLMVVTLCLFQEKHLKLHTIRIYLGGNCCCYHYLSSI